MALASAATRHLTTRLNTCACTTVLHGRTLTTSLEHGLRHLRGETKTKRSSPIPAFLFMSSFFTSAGLAGWAVGDPSGAMETVSIYSGMVSEFASAMTADVRAKLSGGGES